MRAADSPHLFEVHMPLLTVAERLAEQEREAITAPFAAILTPMTVLHRDGTTRLALATPAAVARRRDDGRHYVG